jgi:hypothetical protein
METRPRRIVQSQGFQALCMTQRVIDELERQSLRCRNSLEAVLEPEIERFDTLQRASERLLIEEPERWRPVAELYGELGDLLRAEAGELEAEISIHQALIGALREDLGDLESVAYGTSVDRCGS